VKTGWNHKVRLKHLLTLEEDHESVQKSMNALADEIKKQPCFIRFNVCRFRAIPRGDDVVSPVDYANKLLDRLYDYADDNRIWIS